MTFQAWLQQAIARLAESDSPRRDAEILLGHVTGRARTWILAFGETTLSADEAARLEALLVRRPRLAPIALSLLPLSEPTRHLRISYAVFCLPPPPASCQTPLFVSLGLSFQ